MQLRASVNETFKNVLFYFINLKNGGIFGGHPDQFIQYGIEISSGSLGLGLSIGEGVAIAAKKKRQKLSSFCFNG